MFIKVHLVSGFLFLPQGFYNGGWLFSFLSLFGVVLITMYCYLSISECSDKLRTYSLAKIGNRAFGKCGKYAIEIIIATTQV
jgi:proton-coupled amino acid transporter